MEAAAAYLDVETTGTDRRRHSVIEVAAVAAAADGLELASFSSLCNPGPEAMLLADRRAMAVNRIGEEEVRAAPPSAQVAAALRGFLATHGLPPLWSFNLGFDRPFVEGPPWSLAGPWGGCVMGAAMGPMGRAGALGERWDGSPKWPTLGEACRFFGVARAGAHRALLDARAAAAVHRAALARAESLGGGAARA